MFALCFKLRTSDFFLPTAFANCQVIKKDIDLLIKLYTAFVKTHYNKKIIQVSVSTHHNSFIINILYYNIETTETSFMKYVNKIYDYFDEQMLFVYQHNVFVDSMCFFIDQHKIKGSTFSIRRDLITCFVFTLCIILSQEKTSANGKNIPLQSPHVWE
jgi:hypothetical protein